MNYDKYVERIEKLIAKAELGDGEVIYDSYIIEMQKVVRDMINEIREDINK